MAKDLNQYNFTGRLGKDPDVRFLKDGKAVANFSVAVNNYKNETTWVNVVSFGKQAESIGEYLSKGSQVFVTGEYTNRDWTDRDGNKRTSIEIVARDVIFLGGGGKKREPDSRRTAPRDDYRQPAGDDEIPF